MKLFLSAALLVSTVTAQDLLGDCTDCLDDVDDARDCLRDCNTPMVNSLGLDTTLLSECLRIDGDFGRVQTLDDIAECCNLDGTCTNDLFDVQACLGTCLDTCLQDDAKAYLDCVRFETGQDGCELTECLNGFLADDIEDDINLVGSEDIFDLRSVANTVQGISEDDVEDCALLRDFVNTACDLGRDCCDKCEAQLGAVVGCLINDVVIPFVRIESNNTSIEQCPIDEDTCRLDISAVRKTEELTAEEAELFNKALNYPRSDKSSTTKRDARKEAIVSGVKSRRLDMTTEEEVAACQKQMELDMISANITHASNRYMECVTGAAVVSLEDPEVEESAAASVAKFVALAFSVGAALLF